MVEHRDRSGRPERDGSRPTGAGRPARTGGRPGGVRPAKPARPWDPSIDDDVTGHELDREVRGQLRGLSKEYAEIVAKHLVMVGRMLDVEPERALQHAMAAQSRAGRLGVVREAAGLAAYRAGRFAEALAELRTARRLTGSSVHLPVMADCERGLGRPERALAMAASPEAASLDREQRVELTIVAAGARQDLGQHDAAVVTLQIPELRAKGSQPWLARLFYAYAEALLTVGRDQEARTWFQRADAADEDGETDAGERLAGLDGLVFVDALEGDEE